MSFRFPLSLRSASLAGASLAGALALASFAPAAHANVAFNNAPSKTPQQEKYFDYVNEAGGLKCVPKGKLAELVGAPNKCYLNLDECAAGKDAITGTIDKGLVELFADLVRIDDSSDKAKFVAACPGENGPQFTHLLGIKGLGYAKATEHTDLLLALVAEKRIKNVGAGIRSSVAEALWNMGDKKKAIPALVRLIDFETRNDDYKPTAIQALGRWNDKGAVPFCTQTMKTGKDKQLRESCIFYLGQVKAKGVLPMLTRSMEKHEDVTVRAMGLLGDKGAVKILKEYAVENDRMARKRIPALVALANLGQGKKVKADLALYLQGKTPLSAKDKEKMAKDKAKLKKKSAKTKKKATAKFKKKWDERKNKVDMKVLQQAAMEVVLLNDKKLNKVVTKALQKAMKNKDKKKWQGHVYATVALAQRGDKKANQAVIKLLDSSEEKVRLAVLDAVGGRDNAPGSNWMNRGQGAVADKKVIDGVFKLYENEGKTARRTKALHAAVAIRAMSEL